MTETINTILARRSVREYKNTPVEKDKLEMLLKCAVNSPSAMNRQRWHFTAITNAEALNAFNAEYRAQAANSDNPQLRASAASANVFHSAPAVIMLSGDPGSEVNTGIAAENICVAAQSLGLGSCIIGLVRVVYEGPNCAEYRKLMGIPDDMEPILGICVGYPADGLVPREKELAPNTVSWIE